MRMSQRWIAVLCLILFCPVARAGTPAPRKPKSVEPRARGAVQGVVLDRETGRPIEDAEVKVEEDGRFADSGDTVGPTDKRGEFQVRTPLGQRSSKFDLEQALMTFPFGLIIPGGMNRVTHVIHVTRVDLRVEKAGYKTFEGPVEVLSSNPNRFSIRLDDVLLAPASSALQSFAPAGQTDLQARRFVALPAMDSPSRRVRVEAELILPRRLRTANLWCAPPERIDHWSITLLKPVGRMNPETRSQVYRGEIELPSRSREKAVVVYLWTAERDAYFGTRVPGSPPLLIQIASKSEKETGETIARAFACELQGDLNRALELYSSAAAATPPSPTWLMQQRGQLLLRLERPKEAVQVFADMSRIEKEEQGIYYASYATALLDSGRVNEAIDLLLPFTKDKRKRRDLPPEYHLALARCYQARGDMQLADEYYLKANRGALWSTEFVQEFNLERTRAAMQAAPENMDARLAYAHSLADMKRHQAALVEYQRLLTAEESQPWLYLDVAHSLLELGRRPQALSALERALELDPDNVEVHEALTEYFIQSGDYEKAYKHSGICAQSPRRSRDFVTRYRHGLLELWKGNRETAIEELSHAIYLSRGKGEVRVSGIYAGYGVIPFGPKKSLASGFNREEAEYAFLILQELDDLEENPEQARSHLNLGVALAELGLAPMALNHLAIALEKGATGPQAHYAMGLAYRAMGKPAEARAAFGKAIEIEPALEDAYRRLAQLLADGGDTDQAQQVLLRFARFQKKSGTPDPDAGN